MEETNNLIAAICGHCHNKFKFAAPSANGSFRVKCPHCQTDNIIKVATNEETSAKRDAHPSTNDTKKQYLVIGCQHCHEKMKLAMPQTGGVFRVMCPHCREENNIRFASKGAKESGEQNVQDSGMKKQIAVCPECGTKLRIDFKNNGRNDAMCPKCNSSLWVKVEDNKIISVEKRKTQKLDDSNEMNSIGQLSIVRFGGLFGQIGTKKFDLHLGSNTIGRKDSTLSSNIEVEGDTTMSRRSVSIEVTKNPKGNYLFKMNVLRAANPVLHNNQQLVEGEGVYLNYGDSIRLGKTTFVFDKK